MARRLEVEIVGDASSLHKAISQSDQKASGFGKTLGGLTKTAGIAAGAAGIAGLTIAVKAGIDEWSQSQKVTAQTRAVIKSTGGSAHVTTAQVQELSGALMQKSGVDDEVIQSGENMLLTFTNIRNEAGKGNDVFDQSTKILLDMSTALGTDMSKSAIQLGKALNDPIKGITALSRVGVTFTEGQKKTIKSLVESGHTLEAQKLILRELNKEFGGSAEAVGKTLPGQINIARETINNWLGELVGKAIPVIQEWIGWLRDHWPEISAAIAKWWGQVEPPLSEAYGLVKALVGFVQDNWGTIGPIVQATGKIIENTLDTIAKTLKLFIDLLHGDWSAAWDDVKGIVSNTLDNVQTIITTAWDTLASVAKQLGKKILAAVLDGLSGLAGFVWDKIAAAGARIRTGLDDAAGWGESLGGKIARGILSELEGIGGKAWHLIDNIGAVIASVPGTIVGWGEDVGGKLVSGILSGLASLGSKVVQLIKGAVNHVIDAINHRLEFDFSVDTHIPGVGRVGFHFDPPDIPHLAAGGHLAPFQAAIVGERGPELFVPDRGGTVVPSAAPGPMVVQLVLPDGRLFAEWAFDPLRDRAQIFARQTGRPAFA